MLGIPTVRDRIVLQAMKRILEPMVEPKMSPNSFAFRPNRGAHDALRKVQRALIRGQTFVFETDIKKYFNSINHQYLAKTIRQTSEQFAASQLFKESLKMSDSWIIRSKLGIAQGSPLSPLLANIFLMKFDDDISKSLPDSTLFRYADDMILLCIDQRQAELGGAEIESQLSNLKLMIHPIKTRITNASRDAFVFLGFEITTKSVQPSKQNIHKLRTAIRRAVSKRRKISADKRLEMLTPVIRSFA